MRDTISNVFIFLGIFFIILGIIFKLFPFFGKLPGDINIKGKNYVVYIPIVSSLILSIVLSILLNLFFLIFKKWGV